MATLLVGRAEPRAAPRTELPHVWRILTVVGAALAFIGWTDLMLLWWPTRFGTAAWEFGTITAHLAAMPLPTLGLVLVSAGAIAQNWRKGSRILAVVFLVIALGLIGLALIYMLDLPVVWKEVRDAAARTALIKAVLKTAVFGTIYLALYAWLCRSLWRRA